MKAYSVDLRQRVLAALERGMARSEAITTFQVSEGSIKRWLKLQREHFTLEPGKPSGRPATLKPSDDAVLRRLVEAAPDATFPEYTEQWNELHDKPISHWTLGRAIRRLGLTRKKRA
jgi:transposase